MKMVDDRTREQKATHPYLVIGTVSDSLMAFYRAWACRPEHRTRVYSWVKGQSEMKRVREAYGGWVEKEGYSGPGYRPRGKGHCHIYVVNDDHIALK